MNDLVYSIENIFSDNHRNSILGQNNASAFYIPPYQRGYKWSSDSKNAPVFLLVSDIKEAYENNQEEYYLQYITVKKNKFKNNNVIEIIDGQQRLTSLVLLLSVIENDLKSENKDFLNKLVYGVRSIVQDFLSEYIYSNINTLLEYADWNQFLLSNEKYDEQDIYYMFNAVMCMKQLIPRENIKEFSIYLRTNVKIILNLIESEISSEKIFSNLNTNKVELTNTELIKGLLLTNFIREYENENTTLRYKVKMEMCAMMGRHWDEIALWCNSPRIRFFFFNDHINSIEMLLYYVARKKGLNELTNIKENKELFNFYQININNNKISSQSFFSEIRKMYSIFCEWYSTNEVYNLIGFLLFSKGLSYKVEDFLDLTEENKIKLKEKLYSKVRESISSNIVELEYKLNNNELHRILLSLSVFNNRKKRFDYYSFQKEVWSLEHIFPQNPEELSDNLNIQDIIMINILRKNKKDKIDLMMCIKENETVNDVKQFHDNLIVKLDNEKSFEIDIREKELLYKIINTRKLNSIGNLALLNQPMNSSNSNGMFDYKRYNIAKFVSQGKFVPKHTYDVFSKLISPEMMPDLTLWTDKDIDVHEGWIEETISKFNLVTR